MSKWRSWLGDLSATLCWAPVVPLPGLGVCEFSPFKAWSSHIGTIATALHGATLKRISKLQLVQNAALRTVLVALRVVHVTPLFHKLHWLPVWFRVEFKVIDIIFKALNGTGPDYLRNCFSVGLAHPTYSNRKEHAADPISQGVLPGKVQKSLSCLLEHHLPQGEIHTHTFGLLKGAEDLALSIGLRCQWGIHHPGVVNGLK